MQTLMKTGLFEAYLMDRFCEDNPQVLDDETGDRFEAWIDRLEKSDIINYAERALHEAMGQ